MNSSWRTRATVLLYFDFPLTMTTKKAAAHKTTTKARKSRAYSKTSRCWPGYEPVPGKSEHEEGSCRKKPASRNGGKQVHRETARKKQIAKGGKRAQQARSKPPSATERSSARRSK
jgi:hypothetical protein